MAKKTLSASLAAFRISSVDKMQNIMRQSVLDIVNIAQTPKARGGNMPVMDGHLINSLVSSLNGTIGEGSGVDDVSGAASKASIELNLATMELGDTITIAWTAAHAARQELGFTGEDSLGRTYNQPGNHFAGKATDQWVPVVEGNARKVAG